MSDALKIIAHIQTDFDNKFGLPRQSGLIDGLKGSVVFEPEYRRDEALRGLEGFSHIWLIWGFSRSERDSWSPTVRPPRLGGNKRVGVFATRSPFRPNPLGLSCVRLDKIEKTPGGTVLRVSGIDMINGTPVYDIKPYLPLTDSHQDATDGFTAQTKEMKLKAVISPDLCAQIPPEIHDVVISVLEQNPRPGYEKDGVISAFCYAGYDIGFTVNDGVATVISVTKVK